jgi:hypothetical protein
MIALLKLYQAHIIKWGAIIGGILLVLFRVRQSGKESVIRTQDKETIKELQTSAKIDNRIDSLTNPEYKRLYKKWSK